MFPHFFHPQSLVSREPGAPGCEDFGHPLVVPKPIPCGRGHSRTEQRSQASPKMVGLMVISAAKMVVLCVLYGDFTSKNGVQQAKPW